MRITPKVARIPPHAGGIWRLTESGYAHENVETPDNFLSH
jgi:hypothetical protein